MQTRYVPWMRTAAAALVVFSAVFTAGAQDRDTLWTKISAEGATVSLTWDKNHPWDVDLSTKGAALMAKYPVEGGREVVESLGRATARSKDDRSLRFSLPQVVGSVPRGSVCLFVQLADRRVLPIRRPDKQGDDTAGFRYEPWEHQVRQQSEIREVQDHVASLERALNVSERSVANQQKIVSDRGWGSVAACDGISSPISASEAPPDDVVPLADQEDTARRVCVMQVWYTSADLRNYVIDDAAKNVARLTAGRDIDQARAQLQRIYTIPVLPEAGIELFDRLKAELGPDHPAVAARVKQAEQFRSDWAKWSQTARTYIKNPAFGSPGDYFGWPSTAADAAFRVFGPNLAKQLKVEWAMQGLPSAIATDVLGVVGAALDAYGNCVESGQKQLKTKYDNWEARKAAAPRMASSARDFLVRECRQEVELLDKLKSEHTSFEDQLKQAKADLAAKSTVDPLAKKPLVLNPATCGPR